MTIFVYWNDAPVLRVTNPLLLISLGLLFGGFAAINKWGMSLVNCNIFPIGLPYYPFIILDHWLLIIETNRHLLAPEPMQVGEHVVTQKTLYIALFVVGLPLLWLSSPIGTFFWLVGASSFIILFHACFMEPGIESEYSAVEAGGIWTASGPERWRSWEWSFLRSWGKS